MSSPVVVDVSIEREDPSILSLLGEPVITISSTSSPIVKVPIAVFKDVKLPAEVQHCPSIFASLAPTFKKVALPENLVKATATLFPAPDSWSVRAVVESVQPAPVHTAASPAAVVR